MGLCCTASTFHNRIIPLDRDPEFRHILLSSPTARCIRIGRAAALCAQTLVPQIRPSKSLRPAILKREGARGVQCKIIIIKILFKLLLIAVIRDPRARLEAYAFLPARTVDGYHPLSCSNQSPSRAQRAKAPG